MTNEYRLTETECFVRLSDGCCIPADSLNQDRLEYDRWVAAGGTPEPYITPPTTLKIRKSTIIARLTDDQLAAAIGGMTLRQQERWRAPDQPLLNAGDPEAISIIEAAGADPAVILAPD